MSDAARAARYWAPICGNPQVAKPSLQAKVVLSFKPKPALLEAPPGRVATHVQSLVAALV